jgi:uncharacterized protein YdbL (DUF1318 family)
MKNQLKFAVAILALTSALNVFAAADLEVNTPGVNAIKQSMQTRHAQLAGFYASGAIGLTSDGMIAVHDASAVPLSARQSINGLVAAENQDRNELYKEIATANAHPEWLPEIRSTFAQRWIQRAQAGWWVQVGGAWQKK